MDKSRLRVIIWNEFKRGNTAAETFRIINENVGKNVVSYSTVTRWFAKFRVDDEKLEDKPRAGRPSKLDKDALRRKIEDDPHITIRELEELINCGKSTIGDHLKAMDDAKNAFKNFINSRNPEFYNRGIKKLVNRWQDCIDSDGNYFD
ncbi:unnamed protein product [Bursaphelenchus okinawaensis]|uniref:Mos1 transposase HTH domain-containing protein n=1 Tax=Bursaphelenchus okinawaensis TaxID=465554 RepID=A0A811JQC6_9BILA|nr:unnamed protein product [Bursaphelenchus okinawaensis]CAG9077579.1 unnamed protein product [Bursaphelenchus okinawaensis]